MTSTWPQDDLDTIGAAGEIDVAVRRSDGTVGRSTTIWVVLVGDELYVRSYRGPNGSWYRAATRTHEGVVRAGGLERDVTFAADHTADPAAIDDAYHAKYGRSSYVDAMVTPEAVATTLRLVPH